MCLWLKNLPKNPLNILCPPSSLSVHPEKKKRKTRGDHFKQRFRKNFTTLLEEEVSQTPSLLSLIGWKVVVSWPTVSSPLIDRISQRSQSLTTCQRRPRPPRYLHATSAASVGSRRTTPAPPAGGATAAPSVCAHTERRGKHTTCFLEIWLLRLDRCSASVTMTMYQVRSLPHVSELLLQKRAASCDWMDLILMVLVQFWRVAVRTGTTKSRMRTPISKIRRLSAGSGSLKQTLNTLWRAVRSPSEETGKSPDQSSCLTTSFFSCVSLQVFKVDALTATALVMEVRVAYGMHETAS